MITDPAYYSCYVSTFIKCLSRIYKHHQDNKQPIDMACFRDKTHTNTSLLFDSFVHVCKQYNVLALINVSSRYSLRLALQYPIYGVHLPTNYLKLSSYTTTKGLYTIGSTHTLSQVQTAYNYGCNAITYSPIFKDKYNILAKGLSSDSPDNLTQLLAYINKQSMAIDIFALGGIVSSKQVELLKPYSIKGFASIRYFL